MAYSTARPIKPRKNNPPSRPTPPPPDRRRDPPPDHETGPALTPTRPRDDTLNGPIRTLKLIRLVLPPHFDETGEAAHDSDREWRNPRGEEHAGCGRCIGTDLR